jgi:nucleoside-diphosphate-sugar epimerase
MNIKSRNILIAGATGTLGKEVFKKLSSDNKIFYLLNPNTKNMLSGQTFIKADLENLINISLLPNKIDHIIYLAQANNKVKELCPKNKLYNINAFNAYEIAKWGVTNNVKSFVYCSTGGVYPFADKMNYEHEMISHIGRTEYIASKLVGELLLNSFKAKMNVVTLRPFFILGKNYDEDNPRLFKKLINKIKNKEIINIEGKHGISINPIDVQSAAELLINSMSLTTNEIINIAGSEIFTLKEIIVLISTTLGISPNIQITNDDSQAPQKLLGDINKMKNKLGVNRMNFKNKLIQFVKKN